MMTMAQASARSRSALSPHACEDLLAGIARGEADAFEALYRATDRMIYAYALSLTRNHHDAQDIMMDTYLGIRQYACRYEPRGKPLAWIFTIEKNLVRSRRRAAGREALFADLEEPDPALAQEDGSDEALVLREAMRILSPEERQIVVLHAVSGLKHRELAGLLDLPLSTVLSKYARALAKLRRHLNEEEAGD